MQPLHRGRGCHRVGRTSTWPPFHLITTKNNTKELDVRQNKRPTMAGLIGFHDKVISKIWWEFLVNMICLSHFDSGWRLSVNTKSRSWFPHLVAAAPNLDTTPIIWSLPACRCPYLDFRHPSQWRIPVASWTLEIDYYHSVPEKEHKQQWRKNHFFVVRTFSVE